MTDEQYEVLLEMAGRLQRVEAKLAWALPSEQDLEDQIDFSIDRALGTCRI